MHAAELFEARWVVEQPCLVIISDMLGRRLEMETDDDDDDDDDDELAADAHLCYIVSGNTDQLVASWDKVLTDSASHDALQVATDDSHLEQS